MLGLKLCPLNLAKPLDFDYVELKKHMCSRINYVAYLVSALLEQNCHTVSALLSPHYCVAYCRILNTSVDFLAFLTTLGAFLRRVLKCGLGVLSDHLDTAILNLHLPVGKAGRARDSSVGKGICIQA